MLNFKERATEFLNRANATITMEFVGKQINRLWDDKKPRNKYAVTITTPKGSYTFDFWDSLYSTEISEMGIEKFCKQEKGMLYQDLSFAEKHSLQKLLVKKKKEAIPDPIYVLEYLQISEPSSFKDFCLNCGYSTDSRKALEIYLLVQDEYDNLCRIFTQQQLNELLDI